MTCLGTIDAGHGGLMDELGRLIAVLDVELLRTVELLAKPVCLGRSDVLRCAATGADDFFRVEQPTQDLLELVATLRVLAGET